jgi:hypothetical protein
MPIQFIMNYDEGYYVAKYIGLISDAELVERWEKFFYSDKWYPGLNNLSDLTQADTGIVTGDGIIKLANLINRVYRKHNGGDKKAAILVPDTLLFGIARMFTSWMGETPIKLGIFQDRYEALAWLADEQPYIPEQAGPKLQPAL